MTTFTSILTTLQSKIGVPVQKITLRSARPLADDTLIEVRSVFGEATIVTTVNDPAILDGLHIQIGDWVFDAGSETGLNQLETQLADAHSLETIRSAILGFTPKIEEKEVGTVISIKDGVAFLSGLSGAQYFEEISINGVKAVVYSLEEHQVGAVVLGDYTTIEAGMQGVRSGKLISVGVTDEILSRVVNSIGELQDTGSALSPTAYLPIERIAPGVMMRQPVKTPLQTGIRAIDALIPIGRGQRELILGDRQTGKTAVALDTIINQKDTGVICVYVAIGQKLNKIARTIEELRAAGALEYTVLVIASASEPAGMLFLAPYTGVTIAEHFAAQGKDVLIVYDDLTKHAAAYRELSLLLKRPPGREAFPGDVFFLHSRLLERACRLNEANGGGSITALPIVETLAGDISAYIPTNVISITDGQIFLEADLFYKGQRPAVNVGLSVSRVGGDAQTKAMKKVAGSTKLSLAQFREVEAFSQFSSDLDAQTKEQIDKGRVTLELLKQTNNAPQSVARQVLSLFALKNDFFKSSVVAEVAKKDLALWDYVESMHTELVDQLNLGVWNDDLEAELKKVLEASKSKV